MARYSSRRWEFAMRLGMLSCSFFVITCNEDASLRDSSGCMLPTGYERVLVSAAEPYQPWQVRATEGRLTWNGAVTNESELQHFASQLADLPLSAGSAVFQITESVSCDERTRVRSALLRSGLCRQGRCWELEGVARAPIVHSSEPQ